MGMAVAFILGLYLGNLVKALVDDFIMPIIELSIPGMGNHHRGPISNRALHRRADNVPICGPSDLHFGENHETNGHQIISVSTFFQIKTIFISGISFLNYRCNNRRLVDFNSDTNTEILSGLDS